MEVFGIQPSWDIIIILAILLVSIYGFIIGESKTLKALLVSYPAFFMADFLSRLLPQLFPSLKIAFITNDTVSSVFTLSEQIQSLHIVTGIKLFVFLVFFIALVRLSFVQIEALEGGKKIGNFFLFGVITLTFALLFINILLLLYSGYSVIGFSGLPHVLESVAPQSFLATLLVEYYGIFFALPALILPLSVFLYTPEEPDTEE